MSRHTSKWKLSLQNHKPTIITGLAIVVVGIAVGAVAVMSGDGQIGSAASNTAAPNRNGANSATTVAPAGPRIQPPAQVRPSDGVLQTMFVGTSITGGKAASSVEYAYPTLMLRALEQSGPAQQVTMPILREPPGTARNVFSFDANDIPSNIDLGVVELVTNDVSRSEIEDYKVKYGEFVDTFRDRNPAATLLCLGAWTTTESPPQAHEQAARDLCVQAGGYYVQINDLFMDPRNRGPSTNSSTFGADEFHPNNLGEMRIAEAALMPLTGLFPGDPTSTPTP